MKTKLPLILFAAALPLRAEDAAPGSPPKEAVVLFDGRNTDAWSSQSAGKPCPWSIQDGIMTARDGNIVTKQTFTDFRLHAEFRLPKYPDDVTGQKRANSGVYLQGLYEIQVLDTYGKEKLEKNECAAIYGQKAADTNAAKKPEEWQTYDVTFKAARFDKDGKRTEKARVTVLWNGVKVHDEVEIDEPTRAHGDYDPAKPGPIMLQDHGCPVTYRNVWIVPVR